MKSTLACGLVALATGLPGAALAQSRAALNPEISFIGDVRARAADATASDLEFAFEELEIGAQAALNPFARGNVFLGLHDGSIEVEEAFVNFTALPLDLGLRVGRYFVDQGRFIPQHSHQFSFLEYPMLVREYFGDEGFADVGLNPSLLLGIGDVAITLSGNVLSGDAGHAHEHEESTKASHEGEDDPVRHLHDLTYTGRASAFFTLTDVAHLELGAGGGTRVLEPSEDLRASWIGGDFKFKWRPDRRRSLTLAGELLSHQQDLEGDASSETSLGYFIYGDLQLRRHWNVGVLVDYTQEVTDSGSDRTGLGAFAGYSLFEESTLVRLLVRHDTMGEGDDETSVQMQLVSSLGPHKPHQF